MTDHTDAHDRIRELHGHAVLAARDSAGTDDGERYAILAKAYRDALLTFDGRDPFTEPNSSLREHYRAVSDAVMEADRVNHELNDDAGPRRGLE